MLSDFSSLSRHFFLTAPFLTFSWDKSCRRAAAAFQLQICGEMSLFRLWNVTMFPSSIVIFLLKKSPSFLWVGIKLYNISPTLRGFHGLFSCISARVQQSLSLLSTEVFPAPTNRCHSSRLLSAERGLKTPAGRMRTGQPTSPRHPGQKELDTAARHHNSHPLFVLPHLILRRLIHRKSSLSLVSKFSFHFVYMKATKEPLENFNLQLARQQSHQDYNQGAMNYSANINLQFLLDGQFKKFMNFSFRVVWSTLSKAGVNRYSNKLSNLLLR